MALHTQEKKRKHYPANMTLYPNFADKFLVFYSGKDRCWRVTHYSRWAFRGSYAISGSRANSLGKVMRNDWTYQIRFKDEIAALEFAKSKAEERSMSNPVFLLQMDA